MIVKSTTPKADGYIMPGEFEQHRGTILIWPERPGSWPYKAVNARRVFAELAKIIAKTEKVYMLCSPASIQSAKEILPEDMNIELMEIPSDDSWARDVAPTFVKNRETGDVCGVNWSFNAWGGDYDGLYADWKKDDALAMAFMKAVDVDAYDAAPFVLEGGSIHSDGEGTVIVTEACLLSKGRNPSLSKAEIEEKLKEYLGAQKIIWLPFGIYNDETNEHVDNVCAYIKPGEVLLAWTDDENDPQYSMSMADLQVLQNETDAMGRSFIVHKLPIPKKPILVTEDDLSGYEFADGEDIREAGERLAASYVNFYIANGSILLPQFDDENDSLAVEILAGCFPDRKIYPIYAGDIIVGGGNFHCITQQIP